MLTNDAIERLIAELRKQAEITHLRTLLQGRNALHACETRGCTRLAVFTARGLFAISNTDYACRAHAEAWWRKERVLPQWKGWEDKSIEECDTVFLSGDEKLILRLEKLVGVAE